MSVRDVQPPGEALCDSWHAVAYDECSLPSSHDGPCKYDRLAAVFAPETVQPPGEARDIPLPTSLDGLERAWGLIANAGEGDWTKETPEWQEAAARWRDEVWHKALDVVSAPESGRAYESRVYTHLWIRKFVGDHAYAHGLADDVFDLRADLAASEQARDEALKALREIAAGRWDEQAKPGQTPTEWARQRALAAVGGAHQPGGEQTSDE